MSGKLSKFQTREFTSWMGMSKKNHIGGIFQAAPLKASNLMVKLLGFRNGKTLETFISKFPTKLFDTDDEFIWDVIGSSKKNVPLIEARDENGNVITAESPNVGVGTSPFYLVFPEAWFADGEYIVGNLNELYQFRILGDAKMEGSNACYRVELAGGNTQGVPAERLLSGERFSVEAAFVEDELSRAVGDVRFAAPVSMRNEWSTVRIKHKVTGSMLNKKLEIGLPIAKETNGRFVTDTVNRWINIVCPLVA